MVHWLHSVLTAVLQWKPSPDGSSVWGICQANQASIFTVCRDGSVFVSQSDALARGSASDVVCTRFGSSISAVCSSGDTLYSATMGRQLRAVSLKGSCFSQSSCIASSAAVATAAKILPDQRSAAVAYRYRVWFFSLLILPIVAVTMK